MAYEAMNHAGFLDKNVIVILNDNQQVTTALCHCAAAFACVIAVGVGAASEHMILNISQHERTAWQTPCWPQPPICMLSIPAV